MPDAPKVAGFLSYAHEDDTYDSGRITRLRERLERSIRVHAGLRDFSIFQDKAGIGWGAAWDRVIARSLDSVVMLFPVVTPLWFGSPNCRDELHKFRIRQDKLGRDDLILPIYYQDVMLMTEDDAEASEDERAAGTLLRAVQFEDWRALRRTEETDPSYPAAIERLAARATPLLRRLRASDSRNGGPGTEMEATPRQSANGRQPPNSATEPNSSGQTDRFAAPGAVVTLVVDAMGRGDFITISAALKNAPVGARILVRPGHYGESLVIDRPIELVGDGEREDIVVEGSESATLTFDTNMGTVRSLSFRQRGENNCCVWVKRGRLSIENCDLTSRGFACLAISGAADPRVRGNCIHDGAQGGLLIFDDARGLYEDNDIFANGTAGVAVTGNAEPTIRRNRIHDGKRSGVMTSENSRGIYEANDIFDNALPNLHVEGKADPVVRGNHLRGGRQSGIFLHEEARGTFEDNVIEDNRLRGISAWGQASPIVRRNKINGNRDCAILAAEKSGGVFEDNDLRGNKQGAWHITTTEEITRNRNIEE